MIYLLNYPDIQILLGAMAIVYAAALLALFGPRHKEEPHSNTGDQLNGLD